MPQLTEGFSDTWQVRGTTFGWNNRLPLAKDPIRCYFYYLHVLEVFQFLITLLTLKIIVVPLLCIRSPWLVVYMYPSLISIPHGLFPIHSSFQTVPYQYQTFACIILSSIIICPPPLYLSLLQKQKGLSRITLTNRKQLHCIFISPTHIPSFIHKLLVHNIC